MNEDRIMPQLNLDVAGLSKKEWIESIIEECKPIFDDAFGFDFSRNGCLKIAFCTFENQAGVYEDFCKRYFPLYLAEVYHRTNPFTAQAFTNADERIYGILIRLDVEQEASDWYQIILHEMSHLFCLTREIAGDNFTARYLGGTIAENPQNSRLYAGYAIWREFIADYIAYQLNPIMAPLSLARLRDVVRKLDEGICAGNPEQTVNASLVLAYIFVTARIQAATDVEDIFDTLKRNRIFLSKERCENYREFINLIYPQLEKDYFWEITPQFIEKVGWAYFLLRWN